RVIYLNETLLLQIFVTGLLIGISFISFSIVGFSLRSYLEKQIWAGIPKVVLLVGLILTVISGIVLLIIYKTPYFILSCLYYLITLFTYLDRSFRHSMEFVRCCVCINRILAIFIKSNVNRISTIIIIFCFNCFTIIFFIFIPIFKIHLRSISNKFIIISNFSY